MRFQASIGRGQAPAAYILIAATMLAFLPVLRWYWTRVLDYSDEPLGIVSLITACALTVNRSPEVPLRRTVTLVVALVATFVLLAPWIPALGEALLMALAIGLLVSDCFFGRQFHLGVVGLLTLSLPLIASLQFFLGFPVRAVTTEVVSLVVSSLGWYAQPEGTLLVWRGELVAIDAPCSGIKMLWSALFLHFSLSTFRGLGNARILLGYSGTVLMVFMGNVLRTTLLFFTESGIVRLGEWAHVAIGLLSFFMVCVGIVAMHRWLLKIQPSFTNTGQRSTPREAAFLVGACCSVCIFSLCTSSPAVEPQSIDFPGWPKDFQGAPLIEVGLSSQESRWERQFPGRVGRFTDGNREIVIRWVRSATRSLHPASDCLQALGYTIKPRRIRRDTSGSLWGCFDAVRGSKEPLSICEQIRDGDGISWSDTSSWFWHAALRPSHKGYWAWSVSKASEL
jgi:exosortase/archaeosortase family protein